MGRFRNLRVSGYCGRGQNRIVWTFLCLSLIVVAVKALPASASEEPAYPTILVQVYNYSHASSMVVKTAEKQAGYILGRAGVRVLWSDCSVASVKAIQNPCRKDAGKIRLELLSTGAGNGSRCSVWGVAVHPGLARVYYEPVYRLAVEYAVESGLGRILGTVIAHEMGHLLLGPNGHDGIGIMQPYWTFDQVRRALMGVLQFTPQQSKTIRVRLLGASSGKTSEGCSKGSDGCHEH